jgi:hypothetical protein
MQTNVHACLAHARRKPQQEEGMGSSPTGLTALSAESHLWGVVGSAIALEPRTPLQR